MRVTPVSCMLERTSERWLPLITVSLRPLHGTGSDWWFDPVRTTGSTSGCESCEKPLSLSVDRPEMHRTLSKWGLFSEGNLEGLECGILNVIRVMHQDSNSGAVKQNFHEIYDGDD